jgi:hypothetical protein
MARISDPTPLEAVGAILYAAGHEQASYQPPRLEGPEPHLGGCSPGWIARDVPGGWILLAYRPAGVLTAEESYAVQRAQLEQYQRDIFTAPGWDTLWNRRNWPGVAALLVRRAEAGHG